VQQLLWLESLLKLAGGALLVLAPLTTIKVLGLPPSANGFWPRILGVALLGIGTAIFVEGAWGGSRGLGITGLIVINITSAAIIALMAMFGGGAPTRRGSLALWGLVVVLFVLVLFEIAHT
jgi:hypothetical protein